MNTSIPAAPAAPDYAAANKEGVYADISTLPIRNQIDAAAHLGQKVTYVDPQTGQTKVADFTGLGDAAYAKQAADLAASTNASTQEQQLALRQKLGVANAQQTAKEIEAADPKAYAARQTLTQQVGDALKTPTSAIKPNAGVGDAAGLLSALAAAAPDNGQTNGALSDALKSAIADYALGGQLNEGEQRDTLNAARTAQGARGNFLGDAAAVAETATTGAAETTRKQQRLQNLMGLAGQLFGQEQQGYTTKVNAAGQALTGAQAGAAEERSARQETFGQQQQKLANASAMVLGQPITNQFGSLGAAQQGSVGFTPINYQTANGTNANAGNQAANFAQSSFGTNANMWTTKANIAQQDNAGMMSAISGFGGMALGAMI